MFKKKCRDLASTPAKLHHKRCSHLQLCASIETDVSLLKKVTDFALRSNWEQRSYISAA